LTADTVAFARRGDLLKTIIVSLDTLRADRLSCLGGSRGLTPNIDLVAAEGALFAKAFASDIPTQPSHTALFTGRYGARSGIVSHFHPPAQLDESVPWLPSIFNAAGHPTAAVDHLFVMKDWFVRGYSDYIVPPSRSRSAAAMINDLAFSWMDGHVDEDFFLFLHYWDAHIPYVPPSPFRERYAGGSGSRLDPLTNEKLRSRPSYPLFKRNLYDHLERLPNLDYVADLYDAEVAYLDHELGLLFDHLDRLGILDDTLLVLFGDHGEIMTEHDAWFDHAGLYDSVVHVPLVLRCPSRIQPVRVEVMVQLVDVMPTVLETLGMPVPDGLDGRSLIPLITGAASTHRDAVMLSECTWQAKRGVRTERWKYIRAYDHGIYPGASVELCDLDADPAEQVNVADDHPDVVVELAAMLDNWLAECIGDRPDPMLEVINDGLPAVARLAGVIREDADLHANGARTIDARDEPLDLRAQADIRTAGRLDFAAAADNDVGEMAEMDRTA
jgi:arylsulfatase